MDSSDASITRDVIAAAFAYTVFLALNKFLNWRYYKGLLDQHVRRKLIHMYLGLIVMLCWPIFSCGWRGRIVAGFVPGLLIINIASKGYRMLEEKRVSKLEQRYANTRELAKAIFGYLSTMAWVTVFHWRTPLAIATISNLCAGDGAADIVGRRFGKWKLPYNKDKSFAGSIGMAIAGFLTSVLFMIYFSWFGYIQENPNMVLRFFIVSIASALVESHPLSTKLDDNLTVPLAAMLVGSFVL